MIALTTIMLTMLSGGARAEFTREQIGYLTAPNPRYAPRSPQESAQIFYHYFDLQPDAVAPPPAWLAELLPAMRQRRWQDPDGKERSEERRVGKECRSRWSPY